MRDLTALRGDVVTDADGSRWRIVHAFSNGVSRIRVGSLADRVLFPNEQTAAEPSPLAK